MQPHHLEGRVQPTGLEVAMTVKLDPFSESMLTDRYQTTIPDPVRKAFGLNKRDKICYTIQADGQVMISRANPTESDPILGHFLEFLAQDIEKNPQHLQGVSSDLVNRFQSLVSEVNPNLDAPLSDEDE